MTEINSTLSGFYKLSPEERLQKIKEIVNLSDDEVSLLQSTGGFPIENADRMIENVIGTYELPLGIATNFQINGKDYLIPMVIEEPSVIAAASKLAKSARAEGGFTTDSDDPIMIGQIHLMDVEDPKQAMDQVLGLKEQFKKIIEEKDPTLCKFGGGFRDVECTVLETKFGPLVRIHLLVDCRDAMGANAVNTLVEAATPLIEETTGGKVYLKIITNLATKRLARAKAVFSMESLGGKEVVDRIIRCSEIAKTDPYRASTNNKGIMNAISAICIATGNDWRAIEAGAHSFAATKADHYTSLTTYSKDEKGNLIGEIEIPMAVGTIGGATRAHPLAQITLKIIGVKSAKELGEVMAAVGLAQNLAAMRAITSEGIQKGHMQLHAKNLAANSGAQGDLIEKIAAQMTKEKNISATRAEELLKIENQ